MFIFWILTKDLFFFCALDFMDLWVSCYENVYVSTTIYNRIFFYDRQSGLILEICSCHFYLEYFFWWMSNY